MDNPQNLTSQQTGVEVTDSMAAGTVLGDKYKIIELLGCGGFGKVYRAQHLEMDTDVALKLLHPRFASEADAVRRFQREARLISSLRHENILEVYALGADGEHVFMAMELVRGRSLSDLIYDSGPLKQSDALPLFLQICDALAYSHQNRVLHRDLKPDNVLIVQDADGSRRAKVVDFGLAMLFGSETQRLTKTGEVVGDPRYMSPEQAQGKKLDERTDIYSFGCLMYEVLTGESPFAADSPVATLFKQINQHPAPFPPQPIVHTTLQAITMTALQKNADRRFASFDEVADVLRKFETDPGFKFDKPAINAMPAPSPFRSSRMMLFLAVIGISAGCALTWFHFAANNAGDERHASAVDGVKAGIDRYWRSDKLQEREIDDVKKLGAIAEGLAEHDLAYKCKVMEAEWYLRVNQLSRALQLALGVSDAPGVSADTNFSAHAVAAHVHIKARDYQRLEPLLARMMASGELLPPEDKGLGRQPTTKRQRMKAMLSYEFVSLKIMSGKLDEAEELLAIVDKRFPNLEAAFRDTLRMKIAVNRGKFHEVERKLLETIKSYTERRDFKGLVTKQVLLFDLYDYHNDKRAIDWGVQLLRSPDLSETDRSRIGSVICAKAIVDGRYRLAEQVLEDKSRMDAQLPNDKTDVINLAIAKYHLRKERDAERLLTKLLDNKSATAASTNGNPEPVQDVALRTLIDWKLRSGNLKEADGLLPKLNMEVVNNYHHLNPSLLTKLAIDCKKRNQSGVEQAIERVMGSSVAALTKADFLGSMSNSCVLSGRLDYAALVHAAMRKLAASEVGSTRRAIAERAAASELHARSVTHDDAAVIRPRH